MELRDEILEDSKREFAQRILAHPFIRRCSQGSITLPELKRFLVQQGLYGGYFTRYLCALMSNLHNNHAVLELAENLFEELGLESGQKSIPHHQIYADMLGRFDLSLQGAQATAGTSGLIHTMLMRCKNPNPSHGLGALCLGAEALVPALYAEILKGFKACGVPDEDVEFFHIHVGCDDGHAETIHDIMLEIAGRDPAQLSIMLEAGTALVTARLKFFSDLDGSAAIAGREQARAA